MSVENTRIAPRSRFATVLFDVDSTLVSIEGIDWLAEQRGAEVANECVLLTARSMAGEFPIEAVYEKRLLAILPTRAELNALANVYCQALEPGAKELVQALQRAGVTVYMVSGGIRDALIPLAALLHIPETRLHAVQLTANAAGQFVALKGRQALAMHTGKPEIIQALNVAQPAVMIGDGSTDAAARTATGCFIAYTGVMRRDAVVAQADMVANSFSELSSLLFEESL